MKSALTLLSACCLCLAPAYAAVQDLSYALPTDHKGFFEGKPEDYFMYVDRTFEGKTSRPWQGGTFGFTRNAFRNPDGLILYAKFHEGTDVAPLLRDENDVPLDMVKSIAPGVVVYTSAKPGHSNYGRYVVVGHELPEGIIFSLYAHLRSVSCKAGQKVQAGTELGGLGYSGVGLNKRRAHLHLELALMSNANYHIFGPKANLHHRFNGINLIGFNVEDILRASKDGKRVSLRKYFASLKEMYRIRAPFTGEVDLLRRYPFLYKGNAQGGLKPQSLDFVFTAEGIPIAVYPSDKKVTKPTLLSTKPMPTLQQNCTVNRISGTSKKPALTRSGNTFIRNILWQPEHKKDTSVGPTGLKAQWQSAPPAP